ncbi:MAG: CoA synthetase [Geminicoccaceae bacterium]|nr:CoA synthetase [Geminicoccaceae bacterium]MCX8102064.1 CoA synthetase [Geminicoccaceae bacterium]MDW8371946.1 CoA synthetase [Geminicoccaceae bacterium]
MSPRWTRRELLIAAIADLLAGCRHVAVGAASPIPAAGALLARERDPDLRVSLLGSAAHNGFTDGGKELFDCAAQGRIEAFFLSGVQIDGRGAVNLLGLRGADGRLERRFQGCFGAPYLAFLVPRLVLFKEEHTPSTLVERVDFVTAPGTGPAGVHRPGGPALLLTGRCLFRFEGGGFLLERLHPGETVEGVREATGFAFGCAEPVGTTPAPDDATLAAIRGPVARALASAYPRFARDLSG